MPLQDGYGVVIGTVNRHSIEEPDNQGRWPHYRIYVDTPQGEYECVINLKSRSDVKIEQRDFRNVSRHHFDTILRKSDGFHSIPSTSSSGALDFIRHPGLKDNRVCVRDSSWICRFLPWVCKRHCMDCRCTQWWLENGTDIIQLMEYYLTRIRRIYIFGEPYNDGSLGLHNIHMNQGDPIGSGFEHENAIWQDGGLIIEYQDPQPRLSVFLIKFETQSLQTDIQGRPVA